MSIKSLGERIKIIRKRLALNQIELAKRLGINRNTIINYEREKRFPDYAVLMKFIKAFDISPNWLFEGEGDMFKKDSLIGKVDFEEYGDDMDDLIFHLNYVPMVRAYILGEFVFYKHKNKKSIQEYLEKQMIPDKKERTG